MTASRCAAEEGERTVNPAGMDERRELLVRLGLAAAFLTGCRRGAPRPTTSSMLADCC